MKRIKKKIKKILKEIRRIYYKFLGHYPLNIDGYKFKLNHERFDFWEKVQNGIWEPETINVLSKYLNPDSIYVDIGAWIGPTVIYASKKCKKVICFEPDPIAYQTLLSNIYRNNLDNISPFNIAIYNTSSIQKMKGFGGVLGNSMTSLLENKTVTSKTFDALVLDWNFVQNIFNFDKVDLLKIDIEGGEFKLIPELENFLQAHKPTLWFSLHAPFLDENIRKEEVKKIVNIFKNCYSVCLNSNLEPIEFSELLSDKNLTSFPEFLFKKQL